MIDVGVVNTSGFTDNRGIPAIVDNEPTAVVDTEDIDHDADITLVVARSVVQLTTAG